MAIYGNLRDHKFGDDVDDIRGSKLYNARNEELGKIDDVIFDESSGDLKYLVVDSGGWLSSRKYLVSARQVLTDIEGDQRGFRVNMSKEQIQSLPRYDESEARSEEQWQSYDKSHQDSLSASGDVLHREGSTHVLTPEPEQMPAGSGKGQGSHTPHRIAQDMPRFGATSNSNAVGTGDLHGNVDLEPVIEPAVTAPQSGDRRFINRPEATGGEDYRGEDAVASGIEEPVTITREEFLKEGTLHSEFDAPAEAERAESPESSRRFREFEERLRRDREAILRNREDKAA